MDKGWGKVVEETMKWKKIIIHIARGSFCTNMYLMKVPVLTIIAIFCHKSEKLLDHIQYINPTGEEHSHTMNKN